MIDVWLKFPTEMALPAVLSVAQKAQFELLFDGNNPLSAWSLAAASLGFHPPSPVMPFLRWEENTPFINWAAVVAMISCGWVELVPLAPDGFTYQTRYRFSRLPRLINSQWKMSLYLQQENKMPLSTQEKLQESIKLGIILQAMMLRLPPHTPSQLAQWLQNMATAPPNICKTLTGIADLQKRRNALSAAWQEVFPDVEETLPMQTAGKIAGHEWQGVQVTGTGFISGRAVFKKDLPVETTDPLILIFPRARPETTEYFGQATAVLYGDGGVLCHACTIAREQTMPCVTALGQDFIQDMQNLVEQNKTVWLSVDLGRGIVRYHLG
jgi:phosphohistidine swiveling domain-containing protein